MSTRPCRTNPTYIRFFDPALLTADEGSVIWDLEVVHQADFVFHENAGGKKLGEPRVPWKPSKLREIVERGIERSHPDLRALFPVDITSTFCFSPPGCTRLVGIWFRSQVSNRRRDTKVLLELMKPGLRFQQDSIFEVHDKTILIKPGIIYPGESSGPVNHPEGREAKRKRTSTQEADEGPAKGSPSMGAEVHNVKRRRLNASATFDSVEDVEQPEAERRPGILTSKHSDAEGSSAPAAEADAESLAKTKHRKQTKVKGKGKDVGRSDGVHKLVGRYTTREESPVILGQSIPSTQEALDPPRPETDAIPLKVVASKVVLEPEVRQTKLHTKEVFLTSVQDLLNERVDNSMDELRAALEHSLPVAMQDHPHTYEFWRDLAGNAFPFFTDDEVRSRMNGGVS